MKIETDLTNSGLAVFTAMVGTNTDETLMESRELRESDEFNQNTTAAKGTAIAPDLSIAGKIFQRIVKVSRNKQRIEYHFFLQLSEVETGLTFWQDEVTFVKETTDKSLPM